MSTYNPDLSRVCGCPHAIIIARYGNAHYYGNRVKCRIQHRRTCPVFTHGCDCHADPGPWGAWRSIAGQIETREFGTVFLAPPRMPETDIFGTHVWMALDAIGGA